MNVKVGTIPVASKDDQSDKQEIEYRPVYVKGSKGRYVVFCPGFGDKQLPSPVRTQEDALRKARRFIRNNRGSGYKRLRPREL